MKLLALIMALTSFSAIAQPNYIDGVGVVRTRTQEFLIVRNSANVALTAGRAVCLDLTDDNGISVDFCAASGHQALCMIVDNSCAIGQNCRCQTRGYYANAAFVAGQGAAVAGAAIYAHTDGSVYGAAVQGERQAIGVALDALAVTGPLEIYLQL